MVSTYDEDCIFNFHYDVRELTYTGKTVLEKRTCENTSRNHSRELCYRGTYT